MPKRDEVMVMTILAETTVSFSYQWGVFRLYAPGSAAKVEGTRLNASDPDDVLQGTFDGMVAARGERLIVMPMAERAIIHVQVIVRDDEQDLSALGDVPVTSLPLHTPGGALVVEGDHEREEGRVPVPWQHSRASVAAIRLPDPRVHDLWNSADFGETYRVVVQPTDTEDDVWVTSRPHAFARERFRHFAGEFLEPSPWQRA